MNDDGDEWKEAQVVWVVVGVLGHVAAGSQTAALAAARARFGDSAMLRVQSAVSYRIGCEELRSLERDGIKRRGGGQ